VDYRYLISGKPYFSLPAFIPVTFELTILLSALAAFLGMLVLNRLPRFHHPVFYSPRFARAATTGSSSVSTPAILSLTWQQHIACLPNELGGRGTTESGDD